MITPLDRLLDRVTIYRLVLYVLVAYVAIAEVLALFGLLPFSPLALLVSTLFLVLISWAANTLLARILHVPANVESAAITALILSLIITPITSPEGLQLLGWAAILAMASKYILARNSRHFFNPAAVAVVVTSFTLGESASWWVGTASMLPVVLLGGLVILRKVRQEEMAGVFLAVALLTVGLVSLIQRLSLTRELQQLLVESPLFFFASIMLTEPRTAPPTRRLKALYGALVGVLFIPQIHIGSLYSTPELSLLVGNAFSYLVGPKQTLVLQLRKRAKLSPSIVEFAFKPAHKLAFAPGQYMEFTLAHPHADARGNRRYFTLASSPTEDMVRLGVRFYERSSSFKRAMFTMGPRATIVAAHVAGDFTLPDDEAQKLAFIAGGIGITPFRSMLKYLLDTRQQRDITLLYASSSAQDIAYKDVLADAQSRLGVKVFYTLTGGSPAPAGWSGYTGRIDVGMIQSAIPDYRERTFYLSGPPEMVRGHARVLKALGVPVWRIKKDYFPGLV